MLCSGCVAIVLNMILYSRIHLTVGTLDLAGIIDHKLLAEGGEAIIEHSDQTVESSSGLPNTAVMGT